MAGSCRTLSKVPLLKLLIRKVEQQLGTPLHIAAKGRSRAAMKFLVENGAFLPPDINDCRFNPPVHYCHGLEWAYEEMKRLRYENSSSSI